MAREPQAGRAHLAGPGPEGASETAETWSDLAHYVRSADLARALVDRAEAPIDVAFAWGWVTHHLGDTLIHPLVNRGAGALVHGDRERPLSFEDDPIAHIRVEIGLDAAFRRRPLDITPVRLRRLDSDRWIDLLRAAYREVYGLEVDPAALDRADRAVVRLTPMLQRLGSVLE